MSRAQPCRARACLAAIVATVIVGWAGTAAAASPAGPQELFDEGVRRFFAVEPAESARLFDAVVAAQPAAEPQLWQRGISLYYAGRFADGRRQFELHRPANPADVENAAWHFACVARDEGMPAARAALLPVGDDPRVPMREILELFAGRAEPDSVLAAAEAGEEAVRRNQRCYAHLYLGLYHESAGDADRAKHHMLQAAGPFAMDHYMGRVAQVHARLRGWAQEAAPDAAADGR